MSTMPDKPTEDEMAHFNRFGRWPDAECWLHQCAFSHTPAAVAAREAFDARTLAEVGERDARNFKDALRLGMHRAREYYRRVGELETPEDKARRARELSWSKLTVETPRLYTMGIDWGYDVRGYDELRHAFACIARGLLELARMGVMTRPLRPTEDAIRRACATGAFVVIDDPDGEGRLRRAERQGEEIIAGERIAYGLLALARMGAS